MNRKWCSLPLDWPWHSLVIRRGVHVSHSRFDFNNANVSILPPSLKRFYFFSLLSRSAFWVNAKQPLLFPFRNLDKKHLSVPSIPSLEEYQVYLAGVFESNPLKLRDCISFHEIDFPSLCWNTVNLSPLTVMMSCFFVLKGLVSLLVVI